MNALLTLDQMTVRYGRRLALDGVSLAVREGEVYALLGRNGAGKSSLIRCLLGEQRPASGRAQLFGRNTWKHRAAVLRDVGVVPEEPDAPPASTARQLSAFCSRLYPRWDGAGFEQRLARFGVSPTTPFGSLSKGQKGQVLLALALAPSPKLLILDDPTLGLDPAARKAVFEELILELADQGTTVFLTTHDLAGIEPIASRIGILDQGKLLLDEDLEEVKERFRKLRFAPGAPPPALADFAPVAVADRGLGTEAVVSRWDAGRWAQLPAATRGAESSPLNLEEIFLALVGLPGGVR